MNWGKYKIYNQQSKHNKIYCTLLYNMLHNHMFHPFFRPSSGCIRLAQSVMYPDDKYTKYFDDEISVILKFLLSSKQYNLSSGYMTLQAKQIQPADGLKRAETCSCVTYYTIECSKFCCVLTASYIFCIQFIEHNGDVTPKS